MLIHTPRGSNSNNAVVGLVSTYVTDDVVVVISLSDSSDNQVDLEVGLASVLEGDLDAVGISRNNVRGHLYDW